MEHYVGIDVSLELSSVCIVDAAGKIVREAKVASEPEALTTFLTHLDLPLARIGLEAGPLSQWLHAALVKAGFQAVLLETRHVKAALSAMIVKTDRRGPPVASPNCCAWAGSGLYIASPPRLRRSGRCWSPASSCRPRCVTWSSACEGPYGASV